MYLLVIHFIHLRVVLVYGARFCVVVLTWFLQLTYVLIVVKHDWF